MRRRLHLRLLHVDQAVSLLETANRILKQFNRETNSNGVALPGRGIVACNSGVQVERMLGNPRCAGGRARLPLVDGNRAG